MLELKNNYKDNQAARHALNQLTQSTFGFNFEFWYQAGLWTNKYRPYTFFDGEKAVSNVSANQMDFLLEGEKKKLIQIGTVMTDSSYRKQGLAAKLMQQVVSKWENECEFMYLFANSSALEFYPKFGFQKVSQFQYSKSIVNQKSAKCARKVNMDDPNIQKELLEKIIHTAPQSSLTMLHNPELILFYALSFQKDSIYWIEETQTFVVAELSSDTLYLQDVFSEETVDLDSILGAFTDFKVGKVTLGFMPIDASSYHCTVFEEEDTTLFVRGKEWGKKGLLFPILSHA